MSGEITRQEEVPNAPFIVVTTDATLKTFLNSLTALGSGGSLSDIANTPPERALWAVPVANGTDSGSAYIISPEALVRVKARRY